MLSTNPEVVEDFLQHKLALVYLEEYLQNPALAKDRKSLIEAECTATSESCSAKSDLRSLTTRCATNDRLTLSLFE